MLLLNYRHEITGYIISNLEHAENTEELNKLFTYLWGRTVCQTWAVNVLRNTIKEGLHFRVKSEGKLNMTYCKEVQRSKTDYFCDK